jgi:hypothetical protein
MDVSVCSMNPYLCEVVSSSREQNKWIDFKENLPE